MHSSYTVTNWDPQGVNYELCDPKIASKILLENGKLNFCAGNLSENATENCSDHH